MKRRSDARQQQPGIESDAPAIEITHDPFNEQLVIAAALTDPEVLKRYAPQLRPDLFLAEGHAEVWNAMREAFRRGLEVDPATLRQVGGARVDETYLSRLLQSHPSAPPNVGHHVAMLQWDRARADAVQGPIGALLKSLQDPTTDPERVRALSRQVVQCFEGHGDKRYLHDPGQLVREQADEIRKRRDGRACYPFGIDTLDRDEYGRWRLVPGAAPGKVTVVTAVSGAGKSTLVGQIALGIARQKRRVLCGAWEQGGGMTLEMMALQSLGWSRTRSATGQLTDEECDQLEARMGAISSYVRFWRIPVGRDPGVSWSNDGALDAIHAHLADSGCDVAIFDLFERSLSDTRPDNERRALFRLQTILDETRVHGILVQQQRLKDIEMRPDKRPTREGIFGSAAWVEVADTIMGVHNAALFKDVPADVLEIDILKQRYGRWPLAVEFDWAPEVGVISNGRTIDYAAVAEAEIAASKVAGGKPAMGSWVLGTRSKKGRSDNGED